ncbi:MAG: hypothetical protein A3I66_11940 [Burkholderiales bacterium RIFCSPLOWO2_02_FULL_57_36]|nr:MAG: hypothetical protein A3I66_11940 [Burkholderiales bacterium RIFCSPLOWO2_02_FULL_57_36]
MQRSLSFDQAPPLTIPLRFFLSAPLFSLAAALLLLWQGPEALVSRWSPFTLALTHLLTLGFLAMSMIGALLQILPVVAGVVIPRPNLTARSVHALLSCGTALLAGAFWWSQPVLFKLALLFLGAAFAWLLAACATGLWRAYGTAPTATVSVIRLSIGALLVTVLLGMSLAGAFAWPLGLPLMLLTDLHVIWGLLGWIGLLVIGIAYQVIPMFQVTPLYPRSVTRWLATTLFLLLMLWSAAAIFFMDERHLTREILGGLILIGFTVFAVTTLYLLWRRKRPKPDATTLFWRTAMASLIGCAVIWLMQHAIDGRSLSITLGAMFIVGFGYSAVNGMLYKIVPFLVWYHLQNIMATERRAVPNVKDILPDRIAVKQFWSHLAALLLTIGATIWPAMLTSAAAIALGISSGWLWLNLFGAMRIYARVKRMANSSLVKT